MHLTLEELGLSEGSFLAGKEGNFVVWPGEEPYWAPRVYIPGCSLGFYKTYCHYVRAGILRGESVLSIARDHDEEPARRALRQRLARLVRELAVLAAQAPGARVLDADAQGEGRAPGDRPAAFGPGARRRLGVC